MTRRRKDRRKGGGHGRRAADRLVRFDARQLLAFMRVIAEGMGDAPELDAKDEDGAPLFPQGELLRAILRRRASRALETFEGQLRAIPGVAEEMDAGTEPKGE